MAEKKEDFFLSDLMPLIEEVLAGGNDFKLYPRGVSMLPTIRAERDYVMLRRIDTLKKGDVVLFRRKDGHFVLHRVVETGGGTLTMRGDNQYYDEKGIVPAQCIAKVASYSHDGEIRDCESPAEQKRVRRFFRTYPFRRFCYRVKGKLSRTFKRTR